MLRWLIGPTRARSLWATRLAADSAKKLLADMGGQFRSFYMTMGNFDIVLIYEAPDDRRGSISH